jgi:uncharacterized protein
VEARTTHTSRVQGSPPIAWETWSLLAAPLAFLLANILFFLGFFFLHFATIVRFTYDINTLGMPVVFVVSAMLSRRLSKDKRVNKGQRRLTVLWLLVAASLIGVRIYATHIEPHALKLRHVTLVSDKISRPFTLLHLTDIQSAAIGGYEHRVFEEIRALNPDLIVHTGDLLQPIAPATYASELPKLAALFRTLSPPLGMYMVQGDTTGPLYQATPDETGGIAYLHNDEAIIQMDGLHLRLYGLQLRSSSAKTWARGGIKRWLAESPDTLNIVMGHRPDFVLKFNDLPIDLCLAGHTHGGQIRVPFWGPLVTFSYVPRAWARGFRKIGNTCLNVSAGIGAEHNKGLPSIRLNCPPEMTLIQFLPADQIVGQAS